MVVYFFSDKLTGQSKPEAFQEPYLKLIQKLMKYGMGTVHMAIVLKVVRDSNVELREYTKVN